MSSTYYNGSSITNLPPNTDPLTSLDRVHIAKRIGDGYVSRSSTLGDISSFAGLGIDFKHLEVYENNSQAIAAGLTIGTIYRTSDGTLKVVYGNEGISCAGAVYYAAVQFNDLEDLVDLTLDGVKIATQIPVSQIKTVLASRDIQIEYAYLPGEEPETISCEGATNTVKVMDDSDHVTFTDITAVEVNGVRYNRTMSLNNPFGFPTNTIEVIIDSLQHWIDEATWERYYYIEIKNLSNVERRIKLIGYSGEGNNSVLGNDNPTISGPTIDPETNVSYITFCLTGAFAET